MTCAPLVPWSLGGENSSPSNLKPIKCCGITAEKVQFTAEKVRKTAKKVQKTAENCGKPKWPIIDIISYATILYLIFSPKTAQFYFPRKIRTYINFPQSRNKDL